MNDEGEPKEKLIYINQNVKIDRIAISHFV